MLSFRYAFAASSQIQFVTCLNANVAWYQVLNQPRTCMRGALETAYDS